MSGPEERHEDHDGHPSGARADRHGFLSDQIPERDREPCRIQEPGQRVAVEADQQAPPRRGERDPEHGHLLPDGDQHTVDLSHAADTVRLRDRRLRHRRDLRRRRGVLHRGLVRRGGLGAPVPVRELAVQAHPGTGSPGSPWARGRRRASVPRTSRIPAAARSRAARWCGTRSRCSSHRRPPARPTPGRPDPSPSPGSRGPRCRRSPTGCRRGSGARRSRSSRGSPRGCPPPGCPGRPR